MGEGSLGVVAVAKGFSGFGGMTIVGACGAVDAREGSGVAVEVLGVPQVRQNFAVSARSAPHFTQAFALAALAVVEMTEAAACA